MPGWTVPARRLAIRWSTCATSRAARCGLLESRLGQTDDSGVTSMAANPKDSARARLIRASKRGGITLVIGAGVSLGRGVPDWGTLANRMWTEAFGNRRFPLANGVQLPQCLPITLELAQQRFPNEEAFLEALQRHLYSKVCYPDEDTNF